MLTIPTPSNQSANISTNINASSNGSVNVDSLLGLRELIDAIAIVDVDLYRAIDTTIKQALFPALATEDVFVINNAFRDTANQIQRKPATFSTGNVIFVTTETTTIPIGTELLTLDGNLYKTVIQRDAVLQEFSITSLQRINGYVNAKVPNQNLANGITITITGSSDASLNGSYSIEILDQDTIRYKNSGTNTALITDNIIGSYLGASIEVAALNPTESANKDYNASIDLSGQLNFVDSTYITFNGIAGGSDAETIESLNKRTQEFLRNPQNKGNRFAVESFIKQNTNVNYCYSFKYEDTSYIYFKIVVARFDETTIQFYTFTNDELTTIRNLVLDNNYLNLSTSAIQFSVVNPSNKAIGVAITGLSPNTLDMQNQVKKNIIQYINLLPIKKYLASGIPELNVDKIRNIVLNTRDKNGNIATCSNLTITGVNAIINDTDKANIDNISITF